MRHRPRSKKDLIRHHKKLIVLSYPDSQGGGELHITAQRETYRGITSCEYNLTLSLESGETEVQGLRRAALDILNKTREES